MIPATAPEQAVLAARKYRVYLQVKIEDALGVFNDYSDYFDQDFQYLAEVSTDIDARIAQARIALVRESEGNSLAPLLNSDIAVGRAVRIAAARIAAGTTPVAGDFKPLFEGTIDEWGYGEVDGETDENQLNLVARDGLAALMDREIEAEPQYGSEDGTPLEEVMQAILDDWADGIQLYVPTATGTDAGPFTPTGSVLDTLQGLADLIGWVIEYRWDSVTAAWRVTLYEPNREPTGTDWTFGPDDYFAVTQLNVAIYDIRNAITLWYPDAATGKRLPYTISDAASIAKYGRRWMELQEADDSPVNSAARAAVMADPALLDLSEPSAIQEIVVPLFWPVQLGDYDEFSANGVHYDVDQQFGVTGYTHSLQNGEGETRIRTRGKPAGSVRGWIKREHHGRTPEETAAGIALLNFREVGRTPTTVTYSWKLGADLAQSWIHDFIQKQPYSDDRWPSPTRPPDVVLDDREPTYTVNIPEQGFVRYLQVEGRKDDGQVAAMERALIFPSNVQGDTIAFLAVKVKQSDGSVEIRGWATDRALSVAFAYRVGPADGPAPTVLDAESQGGGADGGGLITGFTSDFATTLPADTVGYGETIKVTAVAYIGPLGSGGDGTAQDHGPPVGAQDERVKIEDSDQIADGIVLAAKLKEGQRSWILNALLFSASAWNQVDWISGTLTLADGSAHVIAAGSTGAMGSDAVRYIYWDPDVSTTVLQVSTSAAAATGDRKILLCIARRAAAGASSGQLAFFVPAVGLFGLDGSGISPNAITTTKISDDSITTPKLVALAVTAAKIAANTITASQIASHTITAGQIAATTITAAEMNVATLSSLSADLGTVTAGTISTSVLIASSTFSANNATFTGDITVRGLAANARVKLRTIGLTQVGNIDLTDNSGQTGSIYMGIGGDGAMHMSAPNGIDVGDIGGSVGFFGISPVTKPNVTGSRGGNAALASLLTELDNMGLIDDSTTA